jgi:hypothetical protein
MGPPQLLPLHHRRVPSRLGRSHSHGPPVCLRPRRVRRPRSCDARVQLSSYTAYGCECVRAGSVNWWSTIRSNVVEFTGLKGVVGQGTMDKPVITYISRQEWGRMLIKKDHESW